MEKYLLTINDDNTVTVFEIKDRIKQLQKELKQLQDE